MSPRRYDGLIGSPIRYGYRVAWTGVDYVVIPLPGYPHDPRRALAAVNHYARHNGTPTFLHAVEWGVPVDSVTVDARGRASYTRSIQPYSRVHLIRAGIV